MEFLGQMKARILREFLDLVVLARLKDVPSTGYDVALHVLRKYKLSISPGSIYSVMYFLQREGLAEARPHNRSRRYFITPHGEHTLESFSRDYAHIYRFVTGLFDDVRSPLVTVRMGKSRKENIEVSQDFSRTGKS